jgi:hypothetical protein
MSAYLTTGLDRLKPPFSKNRPLLVGFKTQTRAQNMRTSCPRLHVVWTLACVLKSTRKGRVLQKGGFSRATTSPHILGTPCLQIWVNYRTARRARARAAPPRARARRVRALSGGVVAQLGGTRLPRPRRRRCRRWQYTSRSRCAWR